MKYLIESCMLTLAVLRHLRALLPMYDRGWDRSQRARHFCPVYHLTLQHVANVEGLVHALFTGGIYACVGYHKPCNCHHDCEAASMCSLCPLRTEPDHVHDLIHQGVYSSTHFMVRLRPPIFRVCNTVNVKPLVLLTIQYGFTFDVFDVILPGATCVHAWRLNTKMWMSAVCTWRMYPRAWRHRACWL